LIQATLIEEPSNDLLIVIRLSAKEKAVSALFAYFEDGGPKLSSFNVGNNLSHLEHAAGELVQIGSASQDSVLAGMSEAFINVMQNNIREGAPLLSCILALCQHFGIHNNLINFGAGGTFADCLVCSGGFFWQKDIVYLVSDLSTASPEVPQNTAFVAVRHDVLAVRSKLTAGPPRLFTTMRPAETVDNVKERCRIADELTLEVLRSQRFDVITILDTRFPVVGLVEMYRKLAHRDIVIDPAVLTDDQHLLGIYISPELWILLRHSYQSLKAARSGKEYDLGFVWHYMNYRHPEFDVNHDSFEVEFYHDEDDSESVILPDVLDVYRFAKDTANIFVQNQDGQSFSAVDLLDWWLRNKGKEHQDCVPQGVKCPEGASEIVPFEINFSPNLFHMLTDQGPLDIKHLTLLVKITWLPTPATPSLG